ncbi:MAG: aconitase X catalytic domain-containing protein [Methanocellales archaeon]|nr:aconitase X catalytic domain-containing protein [Methanocellales archaeon]MDD3291363.1 aconitase X catalytic domain-containing protein [Methanocellales archaeon]MDD5234747.1 aconitase X catalytic domain-containing protein [Methanocellales archaeon]MDD5484902.1 aconitase X catalytic domain-containing protein [Methanocellales archaeon]
MHLTKEEEAIYKGELGATKQKAMEILVSLGDIYGANSLIPIDSAQISGVSYKTLGDAGLEWISDLDARVEVPSTLNPAGMDRENWKAMGIPAKFAEKQEEILRAYERLGINLGCTCTPYYIDPPKFGGHLAWAESSAVAYANSVLGVRTNREGGPSALAAAIIGKTPCYGLHLDENRAPDVLIRVIGKLHDSDYGALGYEVGEILRDNIPLFQLDSLPTPDELKSLGAAMAASGAVALYHVEGITPESKSFDRPRERLSLDLKDIKAIYEKRSRPDIIALGCPHCSTDELRRISRLLSGKKVTTDLWICTSRWVKEQNPDLVREIEMSGAKIICDTCMVVSPASERFERMMVNSGKALKYVPSLCGVDAVLATTEDCIRTACD